MAAAGLPGQWDLEMVHEALQVAFGWLDEHLHLFQVGDRRYGVPNPFGFDDREPETSVRVHEILRRPGDKLTYWYDFGDDWYHDVVVRKVLEPRQEARCLSGRRAGPPEDSGGPWGYQYKLSVLAGPEHERHTELAEWFGPDFDPELVDIAGIDARLRLFR